MIHEVEPSQVVSSNYFTGNHSNKTGDISQFTLYEKPWGQNTIILNGYRGKPGCMFSNDFKPVFSATLRVVHGVIGQGE